MNATLTTEQTKDLVDEFVKFMIDDWTAEQLQSYVYASLKQEIVCDMDEEDTVM